MNTPAEGLQPGELKRLANSAKSQAQVASDPDTRDRLYSFARAADQLSVVLLNGGVAPSAVPSNDTDVFGLLQSS